MAKEAYPEQYNVLVVGMEKVGKTSLLSKYLYDEFTEDTKDLGANECASIVINKKEIAMQFLEVTGALTHRIGTHQKVHAVFLIKC